MKYNFDRHEPTTQTMFSKDFSFLFPFIQTLVKPLNTHTNVFFRCNLQKFVPTLNKINPYYTSIYASLISITVGYRSSFWGRSSSSNVR